MSDTGAINIRHAGRRMDTRYTLSHMAKVQGHAAVSISIRVPPEILEDIDARAKQRDLTRTAYLLKAAMGELDTADLTTLERFEQIESRLERVERLAFDQ